MTIDSKTDRSGKADSAKWAPRGRRQGETAGWAGTARADKTEKAESAGDETNFAAASAPPIGWPRVFPGI